MFAYSRCGVGVDCTADYDGRHSIACNWCVLRWTAPQRLGSIVLLLILLAGVVKFVRQLFWSVFESFVSSVVGKWLAFVIVLLFLANLFGLRMAAKVQVRWCWLLRRPWRCMLGCCAKSANRVVVAVVARRCRWFCDGGILEVRHGWCLYDRWALKMRPSVILGNDGSDVVVALLYALVALASVGVVHWRDMIDQPLTVAGQAFMPGWAMTYFLIAGAICTTLNSSFSCREPFGGELGWVDSRVAGSA